MRKVAIIIPTYNNLENLEETIKSLLENTDYEYRVILVNPPSSDGTNEYCDYLAKKYENFESYHPKTKSSIEACNFGIEKTNPNEDVFLTQDDVIIPKLRGRNWLFEMAETSERMENAGIITTLNGGGISGIEYVQGMRWVGTWSMYLPRRTINKVGLFDDKMKIGEDIDYTYRVYQKGLDVITLNLWFEHHQMRKTAHQPQDEEVKRQAEKYFKQKHDIKN